jgi:hypothetical protein
MNDDDLRRRAAVVREVPLETVLLLRGAVRDPCDRSKWHTEQGPLSITGPKFINWHREAGGGKAIDLVMHLAEVDFRTAVAWLEQHVAVGHFAAGGAAAYACRRELPLAQRHTTLELPVRENRMLERVLGYLTGRRCLSASLLGPLVESGRLYADGRGNAVFLLVAGKAHRPVGAELRGTGARVWRGMAAGTHKDWGYFWIGGRGSKEIVLCESAIDAISCFQMQPERICISTSGVRANPAWLRGLIARGYEIHCGFDADRPGDAAATRMMALYSVVKRLRPSAHDWNDALASGH